MTRYRADPEDALVLAIDQGGHATRAFVFDRAGEAVVHTAVEIETRTPGPDRVEHDAEALVRSAEVAIDRVLADLGPRGADVSAAGLATQRSSIVCWDRTTGAALSPVLSWQDRRGAALVAALQPRAPVIRARTGLVLSPHYGASKLRWCLDHLPIVRAAARDGRLAWGPLAGFLLFRLLAERPHVVDPANASRTQLWNLRERAWDPQLMAMFGLSADALPESVPSRGLFGHIVRGEMRIPLTVTTGDQGAALFAGGAPSNGAVSVNAGTGAFVQRAVGASPVDVPGLLASVAWQNDREALYVLEGTVNGAGRAMAEIGRELSFGSSADAFDAAARSAASASPVPLFLNGVSGLGSPYWIPDFRSRFVGSGDAEARMAAVLESVVFLIAVNVEHMAAATGPLSRIVATGGVAAHDIFCQNLADVTRTPVARAAQREATVRGLAWLIADDPSGWRDEAPDAVFTPGSRIAPVERLAQWRAAMEAAVRDRSD